MHLGYYSVQLDIRKDSPFRVSIHSNGDCYLNYPAIVESRCQIDVRKFPFDSQTCPLEFGSWAYDGLSVDIVPKNPTGDTTPAVQSVEWNVISFNTTRIETFYTCCPEPYPTVTFYLVIERKSMFYVLNILFPSMLLTVMSLMTFMLPSESGEKVGFLMTLLLALAVFQLMVGDSLPPSAETIPIICKLEAHTSTCLLW